MYDRGDPLGNGPIGPDLQTPPGRCGRHL